MPRHLALTVIIALGFGAIFLFSASVNASAAMQITVTPTSQITPTFDTARLAQPPTVFPPQQADNGAQTYWGMCMVCHGDHGQGLTDEWRGSYPGKYRNCWESGCHGSDHPINSFEILETGAPALVGAGKLARFSNAFELYSYIQQNMPLFPAGSLTSEEAWSLTAYILRLNDRQPDGFILNDTNSSVILIHRKVQLPESKIPGSLILAGILILSAIGLSLQNNQHE